MIIDQKFKQFVADVQGRYTYTESYMDENSNVFLIIKGNRYMVSSGELKPYYEGYIKSSMTKEQAITRTVNYLVKLAKSYEN